MANRKPIVIGSTGQQQELQAGDTLVDGSGNPFSGGGGGGGSSVYPMTTPSAGDFTWVNQGSATLTTNANGSISALAPKGSALSLRLLVRSLPASTPYTITAGIVFSGGVYLNYQSAGIIVRNSSSGAFKLFGPGVETAGFYLLAQRFTNATTFSANAKTQLFPIGPGVIFLRLKDDGTNLIYSYSFDGYAWIQFHSETRTTFTTPDQAGFYVEDRTNTYDAAVTVFHWVQSTP